MHMQSSPAAVKRGGAFIPTHTMRGNGWCLDCGHAEPSYIHDDREPLLRDIKLGDK